EPRRRRVESGSTAGAALPLVALTLVEIAPLRRRDELLGRAAVAGVVALGLTPERHPHAVMEIVVPQRVEAIAPTVPGPDQPRLLRLVLGHENGGAPPRRHAHLAGDRRQDMIGRLVEDALGGI